MIGTKIMRKDNQREFWPVDDFLREQGKGGFVSDRPAPVALVAVEGEPGGEKTFADEPIIGAVVVGLGKSAVEIDIVALSDERPAAAAIELGHKIALLEVAVYGVEHDAEREEEIVEMIDVLATEGTAA